MAVFYVTIFAFSCNFQNHELLPMTIQRDAPHCTGWATKDTNIVIVGSFSRKKK